MSYLEPEEQAKVDALPRDHAPTTYKVMITMKKRRNSKDSKLWVNYVRASSQKRAELVSYFQFHGIHLPLFRKQGFKIHEVFARVADPVTDLGMSPTPEALKQKLQQPNLFATPQGEAACA